MIKPLTYHKPSGEWGIEGVDLTSLSPKVYGALAKLHRLEHPLSDTWSEKLRQASDEEMAKLFEDIFSCPPTPDMPCKNNTSFPCRKCWLDWLLSPAEEEQNE